MLAERLRFGSHHPVQLAYEMVGVHSKRFYRYPGSVRCRKADAGRPDAEPCWCPCWEAEAEKRRCWKVIIGSFITRYTKTELAFEIVGTTHGKLPDTGNDT